MAQAERGAPVEVWCLWCRTWVPLAGRDGRDVRREHDAEHHPDRVKNRKDGIESERADEERFAMARRADQSDEYLHEAKWIIAACLADGREPEEELEAASLVLGALATAGWHLLNCDDAEEMLAAYVMQQIR